MVEAVEEAKEAETEVARVEVRAGAEEVEEESSATNLRGLLREMEESIRWQMFAGIQAVLDSLKKLLSSPGGSLLKEPTCVIEYRGETLTHKMLRGKVEQFEISSTQQLLDVCLALAGATSNAKQCRGGARASGRLAGGKDAVAAAKADKAAKAAEGRRRSAARAAAEKGRVRETQREAGAVVVGWRGGATRRRSRPRLSTRARGAHRLGL